MTLRKVARWLRDKTTKTSGSIGTSDYCWACANRQCGYGYTNTCACCRSAHHG